MHTQMKKRSFPFCFEFWAVRWDIQTVLEAAGEYMFSACVQFAMSNLMGEYHMISPVVKINGA